MSENLGMDRLGPTVDDLAASLEFFAGTIGWTQFRGNPDDPSVFVMDGDAKLTLWQQRGDVAFDQHTTVGLDHTALKVTWRAQLIALFDVVVNWPGVNVEFAPELSGTAPKEHPMISAPGGTRLELSYDPR